MPDSRNSLNSEDDIRTDHGKIIADLHCMINNGIVTPLESSHRTIEINGSMYTRAQSFRQNEHSNFINWSDFRCDVDQRVQQVLWKQYCQAREDYNNPSNKTPFSSSEPSFHLHGDVYTFDGYYFNLM